MATSVFTTWSDLYEAMLDRLASNDTTVGYAQVGSDKKIGWQTHSEFLTLLNYVENRSRMESGTVYTRSVAKNIGRR